MAFREKLKKIKWKRYIFYAVIMVFLAVCLFMTDTLAQPVNRKWIVLFEKTAIAVMLSVSLSFVVGFLGELSLGHAGFMCIGAYLGGKISVLLEGTLGNSLPNLLISVLAGGVIAAIAGLISMVGDLTASAIKRNYDIKDYGKLIPGHGGILDRFDSMIITAPIIYFLALHML